MESKLKLDVLIVELPKEAYNDKRFSRTG